MLTIVTALLLQSCVLGFLVKADSEGNKGPIGYNRTEADGANLLARALPDDGIVMWRAFVYGNGVHVVLLPKLLVSEIVLYPELLFVLSS